MPSLMVGLSPILPLLPPPSLPFSPLKLQLEEG